MTGLTEQDANTALLSQFPLAPCWLTPGPGTLVIPNWGLFSSRTLFSSEDSSADMCFSFSHRRQHISLTVIAY